MIQDNLRLISYDAVVSFTVHEHFTLPDDIHNTRDWIHIFSFLAQNAESPELIKTYKAYWHLFKIVNSIALEFVVFVNSKPIIKSLVSDGKGNLIFTLSFKTKTGFNFFTNKVGYLTNNR